MTTEECHRGGRGSLPRSPRWLIARHRRPKVTVYEWVAKGPKVCMYRSHHDAQVQVPNGLMGALYIGKLNLPAGTHVDKDVTMVLNDAGTIGLSLNGRSFPATTAYTMKLGQTMLVNYFNEGLQIHPMHLHAPHGLVIAKDGVELKQPYYSDTIDVAPGERWSVLYTFTNPGVWGWHCHILSPRGDATRLPIHGDRGDREVAARARARRPRPAVRGDRRRLVTAAVGASTHREGAEAVARAV